MTELILTQEDINSPAWRKVKAYAEAELVVLRKNLEADATPERTTKLRGQIRANVLLLALGLPPAPIVTEEADDPE